MITGNEPAIPFLKYNEIGYGNAIVVYDIHGGKQILEYEPGMSLRTYLAAQAMMGYISRQTPFDSIARLSVEQADALIAELNKTGKDG